MYYRYHYINLRSIYIGNCYIIHSWFWFKKRENIVAFYPFLERLFWPVLEVDVRKRGRPSLETENLTAPAGPSLAYLLSVKNHKIWISKSLKIEISKNLKLDITKEELRNQDHTGNLAGPAYLLSVKNHKIWISNYSKISNNSSVKNCHN